MTIKEMKDRKIELGLTNEMIAKEAGVPLSTVRKLFSGVTKAPRKQTIDAIIKVLAGTQQDQSDFSGGFCESMSEKTKQGTGRVAETPLAYAITPKDNGHTIEEYYALPDDQRVELIDGVFYDMGAPAVVHQMILSQLYLLFEECIGQHEGTCEVFLSPCDVRLDKDNYTMVQPDLFVLCREYDIHAVRIEGAPDLIVEILSPSTRSKDMILKLYKYQRAGVREYWIVDPKYRTVTVHDFEDADYRPQTYDFNGIIPIAVSGGQCKVDFSRVMKKIARYYEE